MVIFTCIECNNDVHELSGDLDERTCFQCLDDAEIEDIETLAQLAQRGEI